MRVKRIMIFCLLGLLFVHAYSADGQFGQPARNSPDEYEQYQQALWKNYRELETKMEDLILDEDELKVEKIALEGFNEELYPPHAENEELSTSTTDPALLAVVATACSRDWLLRPLSPPDAGGGIGGSYVVGTLKVQTTKRTVVVRVTKVGFELQGVQSPDLLQRRFYSWALAKVLDDMVAKATNKHISHELFIALSGEGVIDMNRRIYWKTLVEMRNKENDSGEVDSHPR